MEGRVQYPDEETLDSVIEKLEKNRFRDNITVDRNSLTITIPFDTYRNLGRNTELLLEDAYEGAIIGYSNEINWHGFVDTTKSYTEIQLKEWAEGNEIASIDDFSEMGVDEQNEIKSKVESEFMDIKRDEIGL